MPAFSQITADALVGLLYAGSREACIGLILWLVVLSDQHLS